MKRGFFFCLLTLSFFSFASSTLTMCPISSSTRLPFSLQVTGVSCNMLCSPTWVLMRQMNIHEEEADIAVWRLCRGCLCAQALWRPHFWGIRAADRHQGTPLLMMQMCPPWVLFWWPIANDPFPRPLLPPWWLLVELMFSLQLLEVRDLRRGATSQSAAFTPPPPILFVPMLLAWDKQMPWVASLRTISFLSLYLPLFIATPLRLFIFCVSCIFFFGNLLCCDVCSRQHYVLKDIWGSMQPILTSQVCVMHACHVSCVAISSCALYTPLVAATFFSLSALFCSSDFSNSPRSNLSRSFSSFYTLLGSLWFAFSHFLVVPVFLYSSWACGFCCSPFPLLFAITPFFFPLSLPLSSLAPLQCTSEGAPMVLLNICKVFDLPPAIFDMRWCVFISVA